MPVTIAHVWIILLLVKNAPNNCTNNCNWIINLTQSCEPKDPTPKVSYIWEKGDVNEFYIKCFAETVKIIG